MPELPEVETMCRGIASLVGCRVTDVSDPACACRPCLIEPPIDQLRDRMMGKQVRAIERRGKRVILLFDGESRLIIEPRMAGLVLIGDPPDVEHLRLSIAFSASENRSFQPASSVGELAVGELAAEFHSQTPPPGQPTRSARRQRELRQELLIWDRRGLGTIRWMEEDEYRVLVDQRLGPDALEIQEAELRRALATSRRAVKVALLDQSVVAGIGNLYASEICFVAGVDPRTRSDRLSRPQWRRLHAAIRVVLEEAIRHEGSTLRDGTYRNALNAPGNYQSQHRVYDRAGESCRRCGEGAVRRIVQAQRSTFFCPGCQRRSGCHGSVLPSAFAGTL